MIANYDPNTSDYQSSTSLYKKIENNIKSNQTDSSPVSQRQSDENVDHIDISFKENKPALYSKSVLTIEELRYCVFEGQRINIMNDELDKYSQKLIDLFNSYVDDYNLRCQNRTYYESDLEIVKNEVAKRQLTLVSEALERITVAKPTFSLNVNHTPKNARVRIMNIEPKYYRGIKLEEGKYHLMIDKSGYVTYNNWIELNKDTSLNIELQPMKTKKAEPKLTQAELDILAGKTVTTGNSNIDSSKITQKELDILSGGPSSTATLSSNLNLGKTLYQKCIACHGANAEKRALGKSHIINTWSKDKLVSSLKGYQDGTYGGPMKALMKGQVASYGDADIEAVAAYISNLK